MNHSSLDKYDQAPVGQLIGMQIEPHQQPELARVRLFVDKHHHNPMGTVHVGIIALLVDTAMGVCFGRTLDDSQTFGTIDLRVDFIRPVTTGELTATGRLVKRGSRVGFLQAEVHNQHGKLVATGACTCLVISPESST